MVRPSKRRFVGKAPEISAFKPMGIPARHLKQVKLALDEYEAIRLVDLEGMDQEEAAQLMAISRSTLSRVIDRARKKLAETIVQGKALVIEGGNVELVARGRCGECGHEVPHRRRGCHHHDCVESEQSGGLTSEAEASEKV